MGGKSKGTPAPRPTGAPQVETPDTERAELAARRALDAKNGAVTSTTSEEDQKAAKAPGKLGTTQAPPPKRPRRDPAAGMMPAGGMNTAAVLTG